MRRVKTTFASLLVLLSASLAPAAMAAHPAEALVQETTDKVLARLRSDSERLKGDARLIYPLVEDLVLPHLDFTKM